MWNVREWFLLLPRGAILKVQRLFGNVSFLFDLSISFVIWKPLSEGLPPCTPKLTLTSRNAVHKLNVSLTKETIQSFGFLLNPFCHDLLWSNIRNSRSVFSALHCKCSSPVTFLVPKRKETAIITALPVKAKVVIMQNKVADLRCFSVFAFIIQENCKLVHIKLKHLRTAEISRFSFCKLSW